MVDGLKMSPFVIYSKKFTEKSSWYERRHVY